MKIRHLCQIFLVFLILSFLTVKSAYAYIDPGSGLLLWQLVFSFFVGALFSIKKILRFFWRKKNKE